MLAPLGDLGVFYLTLLPPPLTFLQKQESSFYRSQRGHWERGEKIYFLCMGDSAYSEKIFSTIRNYLLINLL